jgi:hypothetical protein
VKTRPQKKTLEFFRETTLRAKDELELKFGTLGAEQRGTKIKGDLRACLLGEILDSRPNRCVLRVKNGETSEYLYRIRHVTSSTVRFFNWWLTFNHLLKAHYIYGV